MDQVDMLMNVESLAELGAMNGGALNAMVRANCGKVIRDIRSRPTDAGPRKVIITLEFKPETTDAGQLTSITLDTSVKTTVPAERVGKRPVGVARDPNSMFVADNRRQTTMPGMVPDNELKPGERVDDDGEVHDDER